MYSAEYPISPAGLSLPFQLGGIGKCSDQRRISRPGGFGLNMIFYTRGGRGRISYRGETIISEKGDVIILSKNTSYEYEAEDKGWETCWITFSGSGADSALSALGLDDGRLIHYNSLEPVNDHFRKIMGILRSREDEWAYSCSALIYSLLTELCLHRKRKEKDTENDCGSFVRSAIEYIDGHFGEDITLEELAELSGVTPEHFCKIFHRSMNMRPFEYVARRRIQEAKLLLETTDVPIADIGAAVGYRDKSYFGYVFRKYENVSPSQFRGKRQAGTLH